MKTEIDSKSGCCYGVVRALSQAEQHLDKTHKLISLGSIVHNDVEINRLSNKGLSTISKEEFEHIKDETVLFRAHGEPPYIYELAKKNNITIIDCTCPVVLKLQKKIKSKYREINSENGQIIIFGKKGHAEVNGLVGQVYGEAIVIENRDELMISLSDDILNSPIAIFSQTTKNLEQYREICNIIRAKVLEKKGSTDQLWIYDTICRQVSSRLPHLKNFSQEKSIIIFVSGKDSSNGKALFELCKSNNPRSYMVENSSEIERSWFLPNDEVGICGATSTPKWQLEEIKSFIENI